MTSARKLKHILCAAAMLLSGAAARAEVAAEIPIMLPGETVEATVSVSNPAQATAMQFIITLPEGFTIPNGKLTLSDRASGHSTEVNSKGAGEYRCVIYSTSNAPFEGTSDKLFSFLLKAPESAASGEYPILFSGIRYSDADGNETSGADATCMARIFIPVASIILDKNACNIAIGETLTLTATVAPEDATDSTVTWSSDNPETVKVNQEGNVTALGLGTAVISVTANDGSGAKAECTVTVSRPTPVAIIVTPSEASIEKDSTLQLAAKVEPSEASQEVEWSSNDPETATVTDEGLVTGLKEGTALIYVCSKENPHAQTYCLLTVTDSNAVEFNLADNLSIEVEGNEIRVIGKDASMTVKVSDMEGRIVRNTKESEIRGLEHGVYVITVGKHRIKVKI